jgi:hypothetical protein
LASEGKGNPNTSDDYANALQALYPLAYKLEFFSKKELQKDYVIPPFEALWRADDMDVFQSREKD